VNAQARPAFYALAPGSWRDYVTLLHPPYTVWHLSYVVIGAALAPEWRPWRLVATLAAFLLALGIGAHALDELSGRPLATRIPDHVLRGLAAVSITAAVGIGIGGAVAFDLWVLVFVAAGAFIVCAYNVEFFGGRFHTDLWFALAWGSFPLLTGYFAAAGRIRPEVVLAAVFAALTSHVQRLLSTPVRKARRRAVAVSGSLELTDGTREPITAETLTAANEAALRALTAAMVALAIALVVLRVAQ
jgi:hypothetical protein